MSSEVQEKEIITWVEKVLEKEDFVKYVIHFSKPADKSTGYMSDIVFTEVTGTTRSNEQKILNLFVKYGKRNPALREEMSLAGYYIRELLVYDTVLPAFRNLELERNVSEVFNSVPKCHKTLLYDNMEVVILDNLTSQGYELHDKLTSMNQAHLEFTLTEYAHFHAISLAYRDQKPQEFDRLFSNYGSLTALELKNCRQFLTNLDDKISGVLKTCDAQLEEKFTNVFAKGIWNIYKELMEDDIQEPSILHGDCWNNNFMFKYKNGNRDRPTNVAILDWQLSNIHSPVLDVSYFLYACASEESLSRHEHFLEFYYEKLCSVLRNLGSDPEKVFSFQTLLTHWKKYSVYGLIIVIAFLEMAVCDESEAISLDNMNMEVWVELISKLKPTNFDVYKKRVEVIVRHYCKGRV